MADTVHPFSTKTGATQPDGDVVPTPGPPTWERTHCCVLLLGSAPALAPGWRGSRARMLPGGGGSEVGGWRAEPGQWDGEGAREARVAVCQRLAIPPNCSPAAVKGDVFAGPSGSTDAHGVSGVGSSGHGRRGGAPGPSKACWGGQEARREEREMHLRPGASLPSTSGKVTGGLCDELHLDLSAFFGSACAWEMSSLPVVRSLRGQIEDPDRTGSAASPPLLDTRVPPRDTQEAGRGHRAEIQAADSTCCSRFRAASARNAAREVGFSVQKEFPEGQGYTMLDELSQVSCGSSLLQGFQEA